MLLIVDIGNTNVVLAFFENSESKPKAIKRTVTETTQAAEVYAKIFSEISAEFWFSDVHKVLISSVVPSVTEQVKTAVESLISAPVFLLSKECYDKLPVKIPDSAKNEIGTDLVSNAVFAFCKYKKACVVVDFGTALTFTVVDGKGNVRGVAIAPGLQTACKALFSNTAQLPTVLLNEPKSALGLNTAEAIQSGIVLGYKGLVSSLLNRIQEEVGEKCTFIATGGLSHVFKNASEIFDEVNVGVTVQGLATILEKFL